MERPKIERRPTRRVTVGAVGIGGGAPVSVQSMTKTHTRDVDATAEQVERLAGVGCDIVRLAVPTAADTAALGEILRQVSVPIVADVHFHFERAMEAIAAGVHKIRLNPGNIGDRQKVRRVIEACADRGIPIRIGVNEGSVVARRDAAGRARDKAQPIVDLMVAKLGEYLRVFDDADFHDVVLAAKSADAVTCVAANRRIAALYDYPLHLGVTHAGDVAGGTIRSAAALGALLADGIGDTIRISFTADPVAEVHAAKELLCSLGLRERDEAEIVSCPTCGRVEVDLIALLADVRRALAGAGAGLRVAVMGCVVNGPGEAEGADVAVCAGKGAGVIYVDGRKVATVSEEKIAGALVEQVKNYRRR